MRGFGERGASRRELCFVLVLLAGCGSTTKNTPRVRMTAKDIVKQSSGAIVRIEVSDKTEGEKVGTGFVVHESGLIATNLHVIAGTSDIKVKLLDGTPYPVTQIAALDPDRDLAIVRIRPTKPLPKLRLGDSDAMVAGDQIVAIGNPLGVFDHSVSSGLISQVRTVCKPPQEKCPAGGLTLLQISAPISQGSSGGPLFNQFGEVVGVTTLIVSSGQAINFAVPGNYLKPLLVSRPVPMTMEQFATETSQGAGGEGDGGDVPDGVRIVRNVPNHALKVLDGCTDAEIGKLVDAISAAIDVGAPLYNRGDVEACFRIYEGTSTKIERDPPCVGVGKAFGDGLLRASTLSTFKEKAWALRDTFDGLIAVAMKRKNAPKPPSSKP